MKTIKKILSIISQVSTWVFVVVTVTLIWLSVLFGSKLEIGAPGKPVYIKYDSKPLIEKL